MDLLEIEVDENRVVAFDGRVVEIFGGSVRRFHVKLLTVRVPQADKRGNRNIVFVQAGQENVLPVDEPTFERLRPLLDALSSAGISIPV
jgi:hypothetical protein